MVERDTKLPGPAATRDTQLWSRARDGFCKDKNPRWRQSYSNPHHCINISLQKQNAPPLLITQLPYLASGRTDSPWAAAQVRRRSLEVVHKGTGRLGVEEERSPLVQVCNPLEQARSPLEQVRSHPEQVHSPLEQARSHPEQAGQVHTPLAQAYIHSQASGEELHWKLKSTHLVSQMSFCYN